MARRKGEEKQRIHIWLPCRQVQKINELYANTLGLSGAVQQMIDLVLGRIEAEVQAQSRMPSIDAEKLTEALQAKRE